MGADRDAPALHQVGDLEVRGFAEPLALAQPVRDEPQPALGAELRVEQLERAGGRVPRVRERALAGGRRSSLSRTQLGVGHEDLAADLEQGRRARPWSTSGISRTVLRLAVMSSPRSPSPRVAPSDELALLVAERDGHAVDLELDDVAHRLAGVQAPCGPGRPTRGPRRTL